MTAKIIGVIVLILVIIGGIFLLSKKEMPAQNPPVQNPPVQETDVPLDKITQTVTEFGQKMKMVSLLSPKEDVKKSMEENYKAYVAPELLVKWENNPESAPGRLTSSPYPDRIEITLLVQRKDGTFVVNGNVIELTSQNSANGGVAATYSVVIELQNRNGSWLITNFERGAYGNAS